MRLVNLNLLCVAGALLGTLSLFLTWVTTLTSNIAYCAFPDAGVVDILGSACHFDLALDIACGLFLVGVVLAFLTTFGVLFEISGISIFFGWYAISSPHLISGGLIPLGVGPFVGIASAVIVLLALVRPMGIGYEGTPVGLKERLLTVVLSMS